MVGWGGGWDEAGAVNLALRGGEAIVKEATIERDGNCFGKNLDSGVVIELEL